MLLISKMKRQYMTTDKYVLIGGDSLSSMMALMSRSSIDGNYSIGQSMNEAGDLDVQQGSFSEKYSFEVTCGGTRVRMVDGDSPLIQLKKKFRHE